MAAIDVGRFLIESEMEKLDLLSQERGHEATLVAAAIIIQTLGCYELVECAAEGCSARFIIPRLMRGMKRKYCSDACESRAYLESA